MERGVAVIVMNLVDVKHKCTGGRFFQYNNWRDRLFMPLSVFLVWIFVSLGWSGNLVSWLSGVVTIVGGMLIATNDKILILLGTCSYMLYYLLDYVDGGVARYKGKSGIEGQYVDWIMHSISGVSISTGIFIGALNSSREMWLIPFGFLFIMASLLQLNRFAFGWWSVCMSRQQNKCKSEAEFGNCVALVSNGVKKESKFSFWRIVRIISSVIFHEDYAIFVLPILAALNIFIDFPDFRFLLTVLGGTIYFLSMVREIVSVSNERRLEKVYDRLFRSTRVPDLPKEHFF